jgi:acetate kinase
MRPRSSNLIGWLASDQSGAPISRVADIEAVGHRVVHGGERFTQSVRVTTKCGARIEDLIDLAPLHNPHNLRGIAAARAVLGSGVPQVAVFDTAFHHTLPEIAYLYAIPYQFYRRIPRSPIRLSWHLASLHRVALQAADGESTATRRRSSRCTSGNGASACAIVGRLARYIDGIHAARRVS